MHYLVTGGAGFIGSHLCDRLLAGGHAVHVIDDLSTGSLDNVEPLRSRPGFELTVDTIFDEAVLAAGMARCDAVFHLAAAVGVRLIVEEPVRTIETNVHGTELVLRHASRRRTPVMLASTSEVYGKGTLVPFGETSALVLGEPRKHRWAYACSKALDEFLGLAYWRERQLPVTVVRLFNTVGPRQSGRYGMVVPTLVRQALAGEPLTVFGDGSQTRSFADVADVVQALVGLAAEPRAAGDVFNVGNPEEISILGLARRVLDATGSRSPIVTVPYDKAYEAGFEDLPRRVPDISKIGALIGWTPTVGLDDILARVVAHERAAAQPAGVPADRREAHRPADR